MSRSRSRHGHHESASPRSYRNIHRGHTSGRLHIRSSCVPQCGPGGCGGLNGGCGGCGDCGGFLYNSCGPINIPYCAPLIYTNPAGLTMGWMTPWGPRQPRLFPQAYGGCPGPCIGGFGCG